MLLKMAGTTSQLSWTVLCFSLTWQLMIVVALPEVGDTPEVFNSDGSTGVYLNNNTKMWYFTTTSVDKPKLLLSFSRISLERVFDYISIGEGAMPSPESQVLRWSGTQDEDQLLYLSSGRDVWLTLRVDDRVDSNGFEGTVETVMADYQLSCDSDRYKCGNQVCLTRHDICDGFRNCASGIDETCLEYIVVDSFENLSRSSTGSQLGTNHEYTWIFVTDRESQLKLTFDYINTESHFDFVTVGEGFDPSANRLLSWSGNTNENLPTVTSSTSFMWLTLSTDESRQITESFSVNVEKIPNLQDVTCGSGTFNCENRVCLPNSYVCDGIIHCDSGIDEMHQDCLRSCPSSRSCIDGSCFQDTQRCDGTFHCTDMLDESDCPQPVMKRLDNSNDFYYKQSFRNHVRTIIFTTDQGKLVLTFYLPQRQARRTEITVRTTSRLILSKDFIGFQGSGFYTIYANSANIELTFSTDSEIAISVIRVPNDYTQGCNEEFDCGNGLCIPANLFCDGVQQCLNGNDEPNNCGVPSPNCFTKENDGCDDGDIDDVLDDVDSITITTDNAPNVAQTIFNVSTEVDLLSGDDLDSIAKNVLEIVELDEQAEVGVITESIIGVVNNLYNVSSEVIADSTTAGVLPEALEKQLGNTVSSNQVFTEVMLPNVRAVAAPVEHSRLEIGLSFGSSFLKTTSRQETTELINFSPPSIRAGVSASENLSSFIELPGSIGNGITAGGDSSVPLTFILYKNANIFPIPPDSTTNGTKVRKAISSQVIAANVAGMEVKNLPNNGRVMTKLFSFPVANKCEKEDKHECVFWDYDEVTKKGKWSTEGCEMSNMSNEGQVTCLCNHLTSFAVLVHISNETIPDLVAVDIITYIGSVLSIIGLLICVVTIVAIKSVREKQQSHVHINLCIALIAFYLTFLIGVDRTDNPLGCQITASFIHFFSLSSMAWMTVEAVLLYNLVNKLNRTGVKFLLPVGMVFAWGVPLVVALAVALLDGSHDYECSSDYCFLHPGLGLYLGYLLLIFLMFLFNTIVFFLVSCKFACRPITANDEAKRMKEMHFRIKGIFLFWLLMGMSWIFGLLAIIPSPIKIVFDILFSLFMALQGFAMFYLLTVTNPEVKKLVNRLKCFDGNMFSLISRSRSSRSTTKTTTGSQKSQSKDQTDQSSAVETDTVKSSSQI